MCIYIPYFFGSYVKIYNYITDLKGIIELSSVKVYMCGMWLARYRQNRIIERAHHMEAQRISHIQKTWITKEPLYLISFDI